MAILPKITLHDLCGPGYVFNARVSARASRWIFRYGAAQADAVTGNLLASMGDTPILCSQDSNTEAGLQLLHDTGFEITARIHRFKDEVDHIRQTQELVRQGWKMVTQHVFPLDELAPEHCLVKPATLSYLNNKENLSEVVPSPHVPRRKIIPVSSLLQEHIQNEPVIVKAVTNESSGGGVDIMICNTEEEIRKAADYFKRCATVVIEDFMPIKNNYCMNYAASSKGKIFYVGTSDQIVDDKGQQYGNWLGTDINPPDQAIKIGYAVMEKAAALGYVGFAGLDVAVLEDGSIKVFDLNFRYNASTVPLLIYDSVVEHLGKPVVLFRAWQGQGTYTDLLKIAQGAVDQGYFIPINSYNPTLSVRPDARPMLVGLVCGTTREEVIARNDSLLKQGLV